MFFSKTALISNLLFTSASYAAILPVAENQSSSNQIIKRGDLKLCSYDTSHVQSHAEARVSVINLSRELRDTHRLRSPPWIPNCLDLKLGPLAECLAFQNAAVGTAEIGYLECAAATFECGPFEPVCMGACAAGVTYALYSASQACYCRVADCSDPGSRLRLENPIKVMTIAGASFGLLGTYLGGSTKVVVPKGAPPV
ncbi:hypothetical protein P3342_010186 [Pyrenophora teres f. teres]|uniref:Uncharacterized protein n=2 Tax=Pyrenophora teres f. teres TaxID=97479 RepID=E3S5N5_PYRTT|nr:hypothetical protein PTT_17963 [Pyrenophora teres f. teres 0-1]KAE8828561.1 hypothetical protein PTNB85_07749 [Pyrenophora teres f. teres]KAE8841938.1 hypothetical protein HRS9122_06064 [Pyrenophora teres f. teres]KAE8860041.1 hypothetical protein PTNB29_07272 [Pyrenophora teres f. teres]KAE8865419.1 hypothetical protein PTNB73_06307 [Pyrenophora teres f. teres]